MRPKVAVAVAAVLNLVGAFLSTEVAKTISGGLIREDQGVQVGADIVFAGLIGAIVWNVSTWYFGLPSSSSHALFGGLVGATIVGAGFGAIDYTVLLGKVIIPAVLAPFTAGVVAFLATRLAYTITRRHDGRPDGRGVFRIGQLFSSSLVALAHGTNDAQKTMGVITLTLIAAGLQPQGSAPEVWVICACAVAIGVGTYTGGWRIIKTMGTGLTAVKPAQGFSAEVSTASTILASSTLGFALSTTHVASGSVIGSGLGRRGSQVRWATARRVVTGWVFTLPAAAVVGALAALIARVGVVGIVIDAVLAVGFMVVVFLRARPNRVDASSLEAEVIAAGAAVRRVKGKRKAGATV
jgi:PiT family inorganic phosphate transporter